MHSLKDMAPPDRPPSANGRERSYPRVCAFEKAWSTEILVDAGQAKKVFGNSGGYGLVKPGAGPDARCPIKS